VFNISYENSNSLKISEQDAYLAISTRMLLQLFSSKRILDDIIGNYKPPSPWDILALIAKYENKKLEDAIVILVINRLHNTMSDRNDRLNKNSLFYKTLTNIGDLSLWKTFVISCCTAMTAGPIENFIAESSRKRVFLLVSSLKPPTITYDSIIKDNDINNFNISDLMRSFHNTLENLYKKAFSYTSDEAKQIVWAVLTHKLLDLYKPIKSTLTSDKGSLLTEMILSFNTSSSMTIKNTYQRMINLWQQ
ncbi:4588_t:CDS:2, partial [Scutellospora calospora]